MQYVSFIFTYRKGYYCSGGRVTQDGNIQGECRKQQGVGEKCNNDYHCTEGHLCLNKKNGYDQEYFEKE